jgi:putative sterol carrier protein
MDTDTLAALFSGALPAAEALASGRVTAEGSPEALGHALTILAGER